MIDYTERPRHPIHILGYITIYLGSVSFGAQGDDIILRRQNGLAADRRIVVGLRIVGALPTAAPMLPPALS